MRKQTHLTATLLIIVSFGTVFSQGVNTTLINHWNEEPCFQVEIDGTTLYAASDSIVSLLDITDPLTPVIMSQLSLDADIITEIEFNAGLLYVSSIEDTSGSLRLFDVNDSDDPSLLGFFPIPQPPVPVDLIKHAVGTNSVHLAANFYYYSDVGVVLDIDVSDPSSPILMDETDTTHSYINSIVVELDHIYLTRDCSNMSRPVHRFQIYDIADTSNITFTGELVWWDYGYVNGVGVSDEVAFLTHGCDLISIDISDPSYPQISGSITLGDGNCKFVMSAIAEQYAYTTIDYGHEEDGHLDTIRIVDVSDPLNMSMAGSFAIEPFDVHDIAVQNTHFYVAAGDSGIYIIQNDLMVGIDETNLSLPDYFSLAQNFPNPFNPTTTISYELPEASNVELLIFDITGRRVASIVNGEKPAGYHNAIWNGNDDSGNQVSTGVYFCRLEAGNFSQTIKMVILR
ncbi:T9SS type A sorting domain-containing protein [bacterium]|nr:T9SS type A sorting domain-containing protein [bacterium]